MEPLRDAFSSHPRRWRDFLYVYPVISRRSRGLSIGINLNRDAACDFNCVYCCVDRRIQRPPSDVDLLLLEAELRHLVANRDELFQEPEFQDVPPQYRRLNDIAFSGNGEPTGVAVFPQAARVAVNVRRDYGLDEAKIIIITNASRLTRPEVVEVLALLDRNNGEIWAKLDVGTDEYFQRVNRPRVALQTVLDNILATARRRPLVIQSLFSRIDGQSPGAEEIAAYLERLRWLLEGGARISRVQVYTVARRTSEPYVARLAESELEQIAEGVQRLGLRAEAFG